MKLTIDQVEKLIVMAKTQGVESIVMPGLRIKFKGSKFRRKSILKRKLQELNPNEIVKPLLDMDNMTEDELKYYATPYYDVLQAEKEEKNQKIADQIIEQD